VVGHPWGEGLRSGAATAGGTIVRVMSGHPRRVLVTGGAGFVGSHLCESLLHIGRTVTAVDNLSTGDERNVADLARNERFSLHLLDIVSDPLPSDQVDVVFHLACPASPVQYARLPLETLEVSSVGTRRALDLAAQAGAIFVLASTSEVYGDPLIHPQAETYWGNVDPIGPRSMYDEGKRFAEAMATWYGRVHGLDVRIARIFNTYGPRMSLWDGRVVPTFIRQALAGEALTVHGEGEQTRSFCYVADLVEGLIRLAEAEPGAVNRLPVNLGNPVETSILDVAHRVLALTGSSSSIDQVERPAGDPERRCPDITRAREVLAWEPTVSLEEGLRATIDWARSEPPPPDRNVRPDRVLRGSGPESDDRCLPR
jgi:dTDP-glucose 4,6-dehydratase